MTDRLLRYVALALGVGWLALAYRVVTAAAVPARCLDAPPGFCGWLWHLDALLDSVGLALFVAAAVAAAAPSVWLLIAAARRSAGGR